jgi:hypothetical protein
MRRIAGLAVILTVVLPAVLAYAASFNISYSGSMVFVVPIEDVITEQIGGPTTQQSAATSPSVMVYTGDGANGATCPGGEGCGGQVEPEPGPEVTEETVIATIEEPAPTPTPTPRVPQTPRLAGRGGR